MILESCGLFARKVRFLRIFLRAGEGRRGRVRDQATCHQGYIPTIQRGVWSARAHDRRIVLDYSFYPKRQDRIPQAERIAMLEHGRLGDLVPVQEGAVGAIEIVYNVLMLDELDLGVAAGDTSIP